MGYSSLYLMKDVVAKQLQQIAVARFSPRRIVGKLGALVDHPQLGHQTKQAAVVEFLEQLRLENLARN